MLRKFTVLLLICVLLVPGLLAAGQSDEDRLQPEDLTYLGAFRLPEQPEDAWAYSGEALAYNPAGDPEGAADGFPGSLFATGHAWYQNVAELSIPAPVIAADVNALPVAETLQPLTDLRSTLYHTDLEQSRVGLAVLPPQGEQDRARLYFAWAAHLDEGATRPTHGWADLDLSAPQLAGTWRIGDYPNYVTGDYLFDIPADWAARYTGGRTLATGRFRDGGQGSQGPTIFAIAPWQAGNPPDAGATLDAVPLLLYGNAYTEGSPAMNDYHASDEWSGAAWLTAGDRAAVIFVGTKGVGDYWYGCSDGTVWEPPYPDDCSDHNRGWWSTDFAGQMIFYDPDDLAAVALGDMDSWEPQPYATLDLDPLLFHAGPVQMWFHVGAASFDRAHGLLYVVEPFADGDRPVIHVWQVGE